MEDLRVQSLGHAARLLHSQLAAGERGPASAPVLDLAAAVMAAGLALADNNECLAMLKRYLPGLLKPLSMQTHDARCEDTVCLRVSDSEGRGEAWLILDCISKKASNDGWCQAVCEHSLGAAEQGLMASRACQHFGLSAGGSSL